MSMIGQRTNDLIDSTRVAGISVLLCGGKCHLSYGIFVATLDEANKTERLYTRFNSAHIPIAPHSLLLINQWARARGYTKERHAVNPKKDRRRIR